MTKLECKEIFSLLSQYLEQDLPPDMCDRIASHIEDCPPCVDFVQSLEKTVALCRQLPAGQDPTPLAETALSELRRAYEDSLKR